MKKLVYFLAICLFTTILSANTKYAEKTLKSYSSVDSTKASGKILPTTALEVLEIKNDKALVKLTGWNKGKMTRIVYYSKGQRIISGAFSKKAKYKLEKLTSSKLRNETWTKVTLTTWIENKNLTNDLEALYAKASTMLQTNCGLCHAYHPTHEFSANQWPAVIKGMQPRTPLSKEEGWLITQYAQKHAKQ